MDVNIEEQLEKFAMASWNFVLYSSLSPLVGR